MSTKKNIEDIFRSACTDEAVATKAWKKLSAVYATNMTAIADGIEKKDAKATNDALATMGKSCKSCHDQHKP